MARTGYTLPVFAVAAAKAALIYLQNLENRKSIDQVDLDLLPDVASIPITQLALLSEKSALAIAISDPGDNLDLTRNTPIWAKVEISSRLSQPLIIEGGEGIGKTAAGEAAIYNYAQRLFTANLLPLIDESQTVTVSIILPEGRQLAERTSNAAFGVLEGLSLLGTSGISRPFSVMEHLEELRTQLQTTSQIHHDLVFCLGSNGIQVSQRLGINPDVVVQTGNWLGALLVEAALYNVNSVLLLGYQGKLIKLAGGIFNTSSHLADAKLEIIAAAVAQVGGNLEQIQQVLNAVTADAAYRYLQEIGLASDVFVYLAAKISTKAQNYAKKYANQWLRVGTILFNRQGEIISQDKEGRQILTLLQSIE